MRAYTLAISSLTFYYAIFWPKVLYPYSILGFKKSDILTFFEIAQVTLTPRGSIANLSVGLNH